MAVDRRGKLDAQPFTFQVTRAGAVLVSWGGRQVKVVAGDDGARLAARLATASTDEVQLLLAKATGHFKRGTEPRDGEP